MKGCLAFKLDGKYYEFSYDDDNELSVICQMPNGFVRMTLNHQIKASAQCQQKNGRITFRPYEICLTVAFPLKTTLNAEWYTTESPI